MTNLGKIILVILLIGVISVVFYWISPKNEPFLTVNSYEECVSAGYSIMESYPEQCATPDGKNFTRELTPEEQTPFGGAIEDFDSKDDLVYIEEPKPFQTIKSPLTVKGFARGGWFFEASFPVYLTDWDGKIIAEAVATAVLDSNNPESTWMTEEYVPYEATLEFENPSWEDEFSRRGTMILKKDNPSGLPENDNALEVTISFEKK